MEHQIDLQQSWLGCNGVVALFLLTVAAGVLEVATTRERKAGEPLFQRAISRR